MNKLKKTFYKKFPLGSEIWVLKRHRKEVWEYVETKLIPQVREETIKEISEDLTGIFSTGTVPDDWVVKNLKVYFSAKSTK